MNWHEDGPAEPGEYYWLKDCASPIFTVEIRGLLTGAMPHIGALVSPSFAREMPGQWTDRLPDPECWDRQDAETIPMRRRPY